MTVGEYNKKTNKKEKSIFEVDLPKRLIKNINKAPEPVKKISDTYLEIKENNPILNALTDVGLISTSILAKKNSSAKKLADLLFKLKIGSDITSDAISKNTFNVLNTMNIVSSLGDYIRSSYLASNYAKFIENAKGLNSLNNALVMAPKSVKDFVTILNKNTSASLNVRQELTKLINDPTAKPSDALVELFNRTKSALTLSEGTLGLSNSIPDLNYLVSILRNLHKLSLKHYESLPKIVKVIPILGKPYEKLKRLLSLKYGLFDLKKSPNPSELEEFLFDYLRIILPNKVASKEEFTKIGDAFNISKDAVASILRHPEYGKAFKRDIIKMYDNYMSNLKKQTLASGYFTKFKPIGDSMVTAGNLAMLKYTEDLYNTGLEAGNIVKDINNKLVNKNDSQNITKV